MVLPHVSLRGFAEITTLLTGLVPDGDPGAMRYAVRTHLPWSRSPSPGMEQTARTVVSPFEPLSKAARTEPPTKAEHPNDYGGFVRDPDSNNVEIVCHLPE